MECRICFDLKPQCGKCHQKMVDVPAKFAEMITEQFNVQCSFAEKGCTESVAYKVLFFQTLPMYIILVPWFSFYSLSLYKDHKLRTKLL